MRFDINQKEFPSITQKSIWHAAVFMAPFRQVILLQLTDREADNPREGEKSLYRFMTDLYSDMYSNPGAYYLPVGHNPTLLQYSFVFAFEGHISIKRQSKTEG